MKLELCAMGCLAVFVAGDVFACGFIPYGDRADHGDRPRVIVPKKKTPPPPPRSPSDRIADADRAMEEGRFASALSDVQSVYPKLTAREWVSADGDRLEVRAARTLALAFVRSGERGDKLAWATHTLRDIAKNAHANDPAAQADLGEALAKDPSAQREAREILERLVAKDLVGSAHAYAALAALREAAGAPARELRARCEQMTRSADVCRAPAMAQANVTAPLRNPSAS